MARSQTWTRNVSKKEKKASTRGATRMARGIVDGRPLEDLKRRAEDLGLIVHARPGGTKKTGGGKKRGLK
jgi:hypothetical protein